MDKYQIRVRDLKIENTKIIRSDSKIIQIYKNPKGPQIILPAKIKIDEELSWAMGFFFAEGNKVSYGIGISNTEPKLIKDFMRIMEEKFELRKELWVAYIRSSKRDLIQRAEYWKRELGIKVSVLFTPLARNDAIEIRINNVLLSSIFNSFAKTSLKRIKNSRTYAICFLDGYEAGDGSIIQRNGYLYGVCITVKSKEMKEYLVELLEQIYSFKISTRITKQCYEIQIRGIRNITNLILDGHFKSYPKQWKKLIRCYRRKQYTRSHIRYWDSIKNEVLEISEIAKRTDRSHWAVRDALAIDAKEGLVRFERKRIKGRKAPYFKFYSLSTNGKKLMKIIEEVERDGT